MHEISNQTKKKFLDNPIYKFKKKKKKEPFIEHVIDIQGLC